MLTYRKFLAGFFLLGLAFLMSSLASANSRPFGLPPFFGQSPSLQTQPISPTETILDVFITDEGIFPPVLTVPPGATIQWTNQTSQTQRLEGSRTSSSTTVYLPLIFKGSDTQSNSPTGDKTPATTNFTNQEINWQSGEILPGDSFSRVFDWSGEYPYLLTDSPSLSGTIVVESPQIAGLGSSILIVTTTADELNKNDKCSLREAIIAANTNKAVGGCPAGSSYYDDTIILGSDTYSLTLQGKNEDAAATGDLDIKSKIKIIGASNGKTIIDASGLSDRVFHILGYGSADISKVTIRMGSGDGGGLYNVGTLTLSYSTVLSSTASGSFGGGLKNDGTATLNNSTVSRNSAEYGGGIFNRGSLTLNNSTISGNSAKQYGGGIKNQGTLKLNNVTISANTAEDKGGGVLNYNYGKTYFKNTIIAGNSSPNVTQADCGYLSSGSQSFNSQGYNLVGANTGCPSNGTGDQTTLDPGLGPLQNNGGPTSTHALLSGSPAIDAGNPNGCKDGNGNLLKTDQRGEPRPVDGNGDTIIRCDIGAYEAQVTDPLQTGPIFTVNTTEDPGDGLCTVANCSLREATNAANARANDVTPDEIHFNISGDSSQTIQLSSTLIITDPVIIDGLTQLGASCDPFNLLITLDGTNADPTADGLNITGGGTTIRGLIITHFGQNGLRLDTNGGNVVECNTINGNGTTNLGSATAGVFVSDAPKNTIGGTTPISGNLISDNGGAGIVISGTTATGNAIRSNTIFSNTTLGIDLGGDGVSQNDLADPDAGPNNFQNIPVLTAAVPDNSNVTLEGQLNSTPNSSFTIEFFANPTCDPSGFGEGQTLLGSTSVTTNENGNAVFSELSFSLAHPEGQFITATATDANGNTSEFSACTRVDVENISWPRALRLNPGGENAPAVVEQSLDKLGQSRWYKFKVDPNSKVTVTLTDLPTNYDLTIYKDIDAAFKADLAALNEPRDLLKLNAEFAPDAFAPDAFAPASRSSDTFAPASRSALAFSPDVFAAEVFAPASRSPDAFAPASRSPDAFAPASRSPDVYAPDAFAPDAFAPASRSSVDIAPASRSEDFFWAFASAQIRSLIGVSAFDGNAGEGIIVNTWNNTGDFYVRVRGRDGAFVPAAPFHLEVTQVSNNCQGVSADGLPETSLSIPGGFETLILTDLDRMLPENSSPDQINELAGLWERMNEFATLVNGQVVNVGKNDRLNFLPAGDARVIAANQQADAHPACPYAKNLVADAIRRIINNYRNNHALQYVVITGSDHVIPFFRYQDNALLGPEAEFVPPVKDSSASQASLRLNNVLSQDAYGSMTNISLKVNEFPIPDLPVGRLVETPADIISVLDAYGETNNGVTPAASALVTGYDFLADAAGAIKKELQEAGLGSNVDTLITPNGVSPAKRPPVDDPPYPWNADELRTQLLGSRHDLVFLGGHFSASSALAADYETRMVTDELVSSAVDLKNALIYSIGCHSGYNIVNPDGIPDITREPDWAQAFAQKGATLVAGTGYQYGDTDYIEYSERLYLEFTKQLRTGASVGQALVAAKQRYLAQTPEIRGLHEKSLLQATIFGLPMLKPDLPNKTSNPGNDSSIVGSPLQSFAAPSPGSLLGLQYANVTVTPSLSPITVDLKDLQGNPAGSARYLEGGDGIVTHPLEPTLPLEMPNVSVPGLVLRGVGFRGGSYGDEADILPFTGAPATEIRGVHSTFFSGVFYPIQPWNVNYFDALTNGLNNGITRLIVTPAQHKTANPTDQTSTRRKFTAMDFRLYYSNRTAGVDVDGNTVLPALAAAPSIIDISATPANGSVTFKVKVVGDPTAGVQEVWITSTVCRQTGCNGKWQSHNLLQNADDSTHWENTFSLADDLGANLPDDKPQDIRYMVQAVNGVGLVSLATNVGAYYIPGVDPAQLEATEISSVDTSPSTSGPYGTTINVSAVLKKNGAPLAHRIVTLGLGPASRQAETDDSGRVTAAIPLLALPGNYQVTASFAGAAQEAPSSATRQDTFEITKQTTTLSLDPVSASGAAGDDKLMVATLADATGLPLAEQTVFFVVTGSGGSFSVPVITDYLGRAPLGNVSLPPGIYTVNAYFSGVIPLSNGSTVTLNNSRYEPSTVTGSLKVTNTPPVAKDHAYSIDEDVTLMVSAPGVLGDASDAEHDPLVAVLVSGPAFGSLTLNADGSFVYTPTLNFNGLDTFTYQASDGTDLSNIATVTIIVNPVNDAPVAKDDAYSVDQKKTLTVLAPGVLSNDTDADGDTLTAVLVAGPVNGTLTLNANGSFTYTPNLNFYGVDTFTYKANDGSDDSNTATVRIMVKRVNQPPICSTATANPKTIWPPNKDLWVLESVTGVTDPDGDPVTITITGIFQDEPVGKGKYSPDGYILGPNSAKVRAERDGNGDGRVYHIRFTASDGKSGSCSGEVRGAVVPHDQGGGIDAIDGGALYDSTKPGK
jgi:CSLREA domain-containing protein